MGRQAAVVLRSGHVVAHINDLDALPATLDAMRGGDKTQLILSESIKMLVEKKFGTGVGIGPLCSSLQSHGFGELAKQVRVQNGQRNACAHPPEVLLDRLKQALAVVDIGVCNLGCDKSVSVGRGGLSSDGLDILNLILARLENIERQLHTRGNGAGDRNEEIGGKNCRSPMVQEDVATVMQDMPADEEQKVNYSENDNGSE